MVEVRSMAPTGSSRTVHITLSVMCSNQAHYFPRDSYSMSSDDFNALLQNAVDADHLKHCRDHLKNYHNVCMETNHGRRHMWNSIDHITIRDDFCRFAPKRHEELMVECGKITGNLMALYQDIYKFHNKLEDILVQAYSKVRFRGFVDDDTAVLWRKQFTTKEEKKDASQDHLQSSSANKSATEASLSSSSTPHVDGDGGGD